MSELQKLASDHPYYCNEENHYSNEAGRSFGTMTEFLDEFDQMDVDLNLCFRWDVRRKEDHEGDPIEGSYYAQVFLMLQRKGIFFPCEIGSITESEATRFKKYIAKHWETLQKMWEPLSREQE